MQYENYSLNDFLLDDDFIKWVKAPDYQSDLFWNSWIVQHPEKKPLIEEAKIIISSVQFEQDSLCELEVTEIWQKLNPYEQFTKSESQKTTLHPSVIVTWQRIAAVLGFLIIFASFYFLVNKTEYDDIHQHKTAYEETKTIILPDSSEVILNANSEIRYVSSWTSDTIRQVWLEGEAFFSVLHQDDDKKFIVHSGEIAIEVLGTEFNVNHRRAKTQVVLNSGMVKLHNTKVIASEPVMMEPGELVEMENGQNGYYKKTVNTELYTSWKKNKLVFDGTSIAEIAQLLEDNYGYQVAIQDSALAKKQFKGTVPVDEIDKLLGQIAKVFNADISKNNTRIIMKSK
jgi:ferric-dicitrate binding protein FerR (iron transport regulator)